MKPYGASMNCKVLAIVRLVAIAKAAPIMTNMQFLSVSKAFKDFRNGYFLASAALL